MVFRVQIGDDLVGYIGRNDAARLAQDWPGHVAIQANGIIKGTDGIYGVKIDFDERAARALIAQAPPPPRASLSSQTIMALAVVVTIALWILIFWLLG